MMNEWDVWQNILYNHVECTAVSHRLSAVCVAMFSKVNKLDVKKCSDFIKSLEMKYFMQTCNK